VFGIVTAATVLVAAVPIIALTGSGPSVRKDGPLTTRGGESAFCRPQDPKRPFSFAHIFVSNTGQKPVRLLDVDPVGSEGPIEIVGLLAAEYGGGAVSVNFPTFPPRPYAAGDAPPDAVFPDTAPLEGYLIPPRGAETQLFIGLRSSLPQGVAQARSFRIRYEVDEVQYELDVPYTVGILTPVARWESGHRCQLELPSEAD
jgi:hypothetical protein